MDLADKQDWPQVQERYEAYWHGEIIDRPLVKVTAPRPSAEPPDLPVDEEDMLDWATNPERVMRRLVREVESTYWGGDAFPLVFPVFPGLVAIETAYLGCPYRLAPHAGTSWSEPIIHDWDDVPTLEVDEDNFWWRTTRELLELGARGGVGRYCVGIPDLQGGGHIAVMLRGTERMAMDLFDYPEQVKEAIEAVNLAWLHYFDQCFEIIHRWQDGYVDWLGVWSQVRAVTVECDFSVMISPEMFKQFFLPALEQQLEWVDRTIYHLDGPGELAHLDTFLSLRRLDGIQWVPAKTRMSNWIPLLQQIQGAGKLLALGCRPGEVKRLLTELRPEGVLLSTSCSSVEEADALMGEVKRMFGDRK